MRLRSLTLFPMLVSSSSLESRLKSAGSDATGAPSRKRVGLPRTTWRTVCFGACWSCFCAAEQVLFGICGTCSSSSCCVCFSSASYKVSMQLEQTQTGFSEILLVFVACWYPLASSEKASTTTAQLQLTCGFSSIRLVGTLRKWFGAQPSPLCAFTYHHPSPDFSSTMTSSSAIKSTSVD